MTKIIGTTLACCLCLAVTPARAATTRYLDPIFEVSATTGIVYGEAINNLDEPQLLALDLFEPVGDTESARPAIVFAHGGGFTGGSRTDPGIVELAEAFAARGYVTASISYRLRPPGTPGSPTVPDLIVGSLAGTLPDAMHDAQHDMQAAVRFLRANAATYRIDADHIAAGGISAGASMALEAAYNPDDPGSSNDLAVGSDVMAAVSESGATDPRRIEPGRPPVVMFNGTNDTTAPYPTALMACGTASALGDVCSLTTYIGSGHDLSAHTDEIIAASAAFLCLWALDGCTLPE